MDLDSPWAASEADLDIVRENEWSKIASNFTNAGYREGITAGKESALQEGFDTGFAHVGAPLGRELGLVRGAVSALVGFLASSRSSPATLSEARDISAQLANVRFSDIAPPDLEAEAHAREHVGGEEGDMPEDLEEKRKMEKLEDMLAGMTANGDKEGTARPAVDDVRRLKDQLYALCSTIGVNHGELMSVGMAGTSLANRDETRQKRDDESDSEEEEEEDAQADAIPKVDIDVTKLTPLSPEVISKQATINLGTIGHVAHGKSTVVKAISGVQTVRFKNELVRNITIKLGYANAKIYKCENDACPRPGCYRSYRSDKEDHPPCERPGCGHRMKLVRHVSFVDCPGHDILMATMLNGAAVMDAALLLIAGNETCPQPQTSEHLAAVEIMKLEHIIILQNKVDLIKEAQALEHQKSIAAFVKGTVADASPIVPISAQLKYNIDAVNEYIVKRIPIPVRDFTSDPRLIVIRSFDVNKPGAEVEELKGGVAGGSILTGVLRLGQEVEIRPGIMTKDTAGRTKCQPIFSRIMSLHAENNLLSFAVPGGLIGVGTKIDPTLCRADRLVGQVLGAVGKLPKIYTELEINLFLLRRLLGVKTEDKKQTKVSKLVKNELLLINIGSTSTGGRVLSVKADLAKIQLTSPACTEIGEKVALSRRIEKHWRLVGWGSVQRGTVLDVE